MQVCISIAPIKALSIIVPEHRHTRAERLKSRKAIGLLFKGAHSVAAYPIRAIWHIQEDVDAMPQVAFSVPKRRFKRAVDRHRCRRLLFECYRLQKQELVETAAQRPGRLQCMMLYTGDQILPYADLSAAMHKLLGRLRVQIAEKYPI